MSFAIELDPTTFHAADQSLTGELWVRCDSHDFPAAHWNDFFVVILDWWLDAAHHLVTGSETTARFEFMDGPWYFEITRGEAEPWTLQLVDDRARAAHLVHESTISSRELVEALLEAAATVERICLERGWSSKNLERLAGHCVALRRWARSASQ